MSYRSIYFLLLLLLLSRSAAAQSNFSTPLSEGQTLPDFNIEIRKGGNLQVVKSIHLNQLKGKAVLLDFWDFQCIPCIASMPHILALQEKFADNLVIILVTDNNAISIERLWNKYPDDKKPAWVKAGKELNFIINDSALNRLIKHDGNPSTAWITKDGILKFVTDGLSTTEKNVQHFIRGEDLEIVPREKKKALQLRVADSFSLHHIPFYSFLYPSHLEDQKASFSIMSPDSNAVSFNYTSIIDLYRYAYNNIPADRIISTVKDDSLLFAPAGDKTATEKWRQTNSYSYSLKVPTARRNDLRMNMKNDLDNFFGLRSHTEQRKYTCFVLKQKKGSSQKDKGPGKKERMEFNEKDHWLIFEHFPVSPFAEKYLRRALNTYNPSFLFFNEVPPEVLIDAGLRWHATMDAADFLKLQDELFKQGLQLVIEEKDATVLVIQEQK